MIRYVQVFEELLSYLKRVSFFPFESRPSCSSPSRNSSTVAFLDGLVLDGPGESGELILVVYLSTYLIEVHEKPLRIYKGQDRYYDKIYKDTSERRNIRNVS
jgi:hypothetical protein